MSSTFMGKRCCHKHGHREKYKFNSWCTDCTHEANNRRRKAKVGTCEQYTNRHIRYTRYNITRDEAASMWETQDRKCALCLQPIDFYDTCIDHDHATGKIRGLLHRNCNTGLGHFQDDISIIKRAIEYLEKSNEQG